MLPEETTSKLVDEANNGSPQTDGAPQKEIAASVRAVSKKFKGTVVLEDIDFDVAEGESLVLLGASGSGKTTILRIISGLEEPESPPLAIEDGVVRDLDRTWDAGKSGCRRA